MKNAIVLAHESVQIIWDNGKNVEYKEFHDYGHFCPEDMNTVEFPELAGECVK